MFNVFYLGANLGIDSFLVGSTAERFDLWGQIR
jgi:hypothetical protein